MPQTTSLDAGVRERGLTAMMVLVLADHDATADLADRKEMTTADGVVVHGVQAAERLLMESLQADSSGWAEWLNDPDHANASASMVGVLSDESRRQLSRPLLETIRDHAMSRATTRAIARDLGRAQSTPRPEVIDVAAAERQLLQERASH